MNLFWALLPLRFAALLGLLLLGQRQSPAAEGSEPAAPLGPAPLDAAPAPPVAAKLLSDGDLDGLQLELGQADAQRRLRAARTIEQADPEGVATYAARLARPLLAPPALLKRLIHAVWGQYPNPEYPRGPGKDPPMWLVRPEPPPPRWPPGTPRAKRPKPAPPHDAESADWLTGLASLDVGRDDYLTSLELPTTALASARSELLLRVALLHALGGAGRAGQREAVSAVFQFAFVEGGLFRDECGRTVRGMGGQAVPTLIRIYNDRTRANAKMRRYASYQLDRMDRLRPKKAIAGAPDDVVRADILRAYGEVLALDAVEAVLEQVGSPSHRVRREARWAWLRYVDGPPPPPAPKRKRKLPGGREEVEEKEDYLNYREMAALALSRTYQELFSREPTAKQTLTELTSEIFGHYDRQREEQFRQLFLSAQQHEQAGELGPAVDEFGWILANQPDHPRRSEMATAFARLGSQLAAQAADGRDGAALARALGLLRQALLLHPELPQAFELCQRIHQLDSQQARRQGGDGRLDLAAAEHCLGRSRRPPAESERPPTADAGQLAPLGTVAPTGGADWRGRLFPWLLLGFGLLLAGLARALGQRRSLPPP